jgi:Ca2+-binding EF-hand superfamily protein
MGTLLAMENFSPPKSDELINDIFRDLDLNQDGHISKREFLIATTQSSMLSKILGNAATEERKKKAGKK